MLITGGALLAVFKLVAPTMGLDLYLVIILRNLYIPLIAMGFILIWPRFAKSDKKTMKRENC